MKIYPCSAQKISILSKISPQIQDQYRTKPCIHHSEQLTTLKSTREEAH